MKKGILLVLIGLLLVTSMVGCNAYRRSVVTAPERTTVETHGSRGAGTRNFHHRNDGRVVDGTRRHSYHNYRHDGRVTDTDGIIGNDVHADGHRAVRRGLDRIEDGTRRTVDGARSVLPGVDGNRRMDGTQPSAYRNDLVAR